MIKKMNTYFEFYIKNLKPSKRQFKELEKVIQMMLEISLKKNKVILIGNGGSSAIASHVSVDLTKNSKIRSINFNEADLITCFANDFGHQNWMKEALKHYFDEGDLVILISSSGNSSNIINAAKWCLINKVNLVTFTGMKKNNLLNSLNKKGINFWVNSKSYNHIETIHQIWLLYIVDKMIEYRK